MRKEFWRHKYAYLALILGLLGLTLLFFWVWPSRMAQRLVIVAISLYYVLWGSITHLKTDHLTKHVFYEYLGAASLAGLLLMLVTF